MTSLIRSIPSRPRPMLPARALSTRRSTLLRGVVVVVTTTTLAPPASRFFHPSSRASASYPGAAAPRSIASQSHRQHRPDRGSSSPAYGDRQGSRSPDKASAPRRNPLVRPPRTPSSSRAPSEPVPSQLFYGQQRRSRPDKMNMGSQNVVIPGLTLLNSLPSTHLPPVVPLTSVTTPSPAESQASTPTPTPTNPQHTPGGKKRKAALRKQAEASKQAAQYDPPNPPPPSEPPPPRQTNPIQASALSVPPTDTLNPRPPTPSSSSSPPASSQSPRHRKKKPQSPEGRQPPSAESGGVPDPHPLYLAQSLAPPLRVPDARRILVIMDLNGTLLYRPNKRNPFNFIQRPHARSFMQYCLETFHVAIWSSARPENVGKMVAQLLTPAQRARLVVIWARDRFGLSPADYDARVQCYKRLTSMWADPDVAASHPLARLGHRWDQTNTILVDDSIEKARSEPHNLLEIPEFSGVRDEQVDVLPQVHDYLNQCCYQADVSRFIRQNPFKLDLQYGARY